MRTVAKYALLQIPELALLVLALLLAGHWFDLPRWIFWGLLTLWVIKDVALFPLLRRAYEAEGPHDSSSTIGRTGVALERLDPSGYVRVRGELWRAEATDGSPVEKGEEVGVHGIRGLTLLVRPEANESDGRKRATGDSPKHRT